jgi:hypothetical protein
MVDAAKANPPPPKLQFHFIKSAEYREVPCDGAVGSVTPNRSRIFFALYAERGPVPRMIEYELAGAKKGDLVEFNEANAKPSFVDTRAGVVRQIQVGTYLDLDTAKRLRDWLSGQIASLEGFPAKGTK